MNRLIKGLVLSCVIIFAFSVIPAQARDYYGAIAYSKSTGAWGTSIDFSDSQSATDEAIRKCGQPDCRWLTWFKNSCGALAKSNEGKLGYSYKYTKRAQAERAAIKACRDIGGTNCRTICWACTSTSYYYYYWYRY
jgi:serine/threonine-protein kinase